MNKWLRSISLFILLTILLLPGASALAQTYNFEVPQMTIDVFWDKDGTATIEYVIVFNNSPSADPIDFVDIGFPNSSYNLANVRADVNGVPISNIEKSTYVDTGVALGLGANAIQPGQTGTVRVSSGPIRNVLYPDSSDSNYASGVFDNTYFDSSIVNGNTDLTVRFHLPPGVQPKEPRWHSAPAGFPATPESYLDNNGQVTYVWQNSNARADRAYEFGASFPAKYIPAAAIIRPSLTERLGVSADSFTGLGCCVGFFAIFAFFTALGVYNGQKRKLQYLPPKVAIEGHGIKRGLTAPEAAILMEQPMDKVLSMILFAVIKKNAASVVTRDPLKLNITDPLPEDLHDYEKDFIEAYKTEETHKRRLALQTATINLVNSVSAKMKGFSRKETIEYYRSIVASAWKQVEEADTPQVKSERYDEVMEWTMLDDDYDRRTRDVFRQGPVFIPIWWGRYEPSFGRSAPSASVPSAPGGSVSLPQLPGSDFAASVVNGVQNMAAGAIGSVTDFTSGVTNKTNPVPVSTSSGYRGGSGRSGGCACACACAGCACACAGGGR